MNTLLKALITFVAVVFGFGLAVAGVSATANAAGDDLAKRDEDARELAVVDGGDGGDGGDDGDDGDGGDRSRTGNSNDATNSVVSRVSRDRDHSRGDRTRDRTHDGAGSAKRDWSDNRTNDRSRNDSRASRHTGDATRSNYSRVSRDRDQSRADLTKDRTLDGPGGKKRDFSRNLTNDRTRNDTR
jgi:hypothetical protein